MYYIGVDPGLQGAISVLDQSGKCIHLSDMPTRPEEKKGHNEVDSCKLYEEFKSLHEVYIDLRIFIEKVGPIKGAASQKTFNFGRNYEAILSCLKILILPYFRVLPTEWKSVLKGSDKSKQAAISWATHVFPYLEINNKDGRAESLCIAEYGRRLLLGQS